jgi:hypothetical protein
MRVREELSDCPYILFEKRIQDSKISLFSKQNIVGEVLDYLRYQQEAPLDTCRVLLTCPNIDVYRLRRHNGRTDESGEKGSMSSLSHN